MKGDIEVAPNPDGKGWVIQLQDGGVLATYLPPQTKEDAVRDARKAGRERGVELFIKKADGSIQDKESYGEDPPEIEG